MRKHIPVCPDCSSHQVIFADGQYTCEQCGGVHETVLHELRFEDTTETLAIGTGKQIKWATIVE